MVIVGAGGHAVEVLEVLLSAKYSNKIAVYDDVNDFIHSSFESNGCVWLNTKHQLKEWLINDPSFVVATGNPTLRNKLFEQMLQLNGIGKSVIAKTAHISAVEVEIGPSCNFMHNVLVSSRVKIGKAVLINAGCSIHHDVIIGDYCEIGPGVRVLGNVTLEEQVFIGSNAVILPGVSICAQAKIGAGAVVTTSIVQAGTYVGMPAKRVI